MITKKISGLLKNIIYILLYWIIFVGVPIFLMYIIIRTTDDTSAVPKWILFYIIFLSPIFYIFPYKMAGLRTSAQKRFFVVAGLVIPYLLLWLCVYLEYHTNFGFSMPG